MRITGLSKYDVREEGGSIKVMQDGCARPVTIFKGGYRLWTDDGHLRKFTYELLRHLMEHPETGISDLRSVRRNVITTRATRHPEGRRLKGLSLYEVYEEDGKIRVWGHKYDRPKTPTRKGFLLYCDDGIRRCHTEGHLRYLMAHPEVDACSINLMAMRIRFRRDGTPVELYGGPKSRKYSVFRDIDDVQRTVDVMREVFNGNMEPAFGFLKESRKAAVNTVAYILKRSPDVIRPCLEEAEDNFLNELRNANVEELKPLYAWLCKCIKCVYLRKIQKCRRIDTDWHLDRDVRNAAWQPEFEIDNQ